MSLCRYLPTPSDRMGILWSLLCIEDAIVLEYGPAGTTHFSMVLYGRIGVDQHTRLFTTHMSEDDVVMGDVSRLEKAILEIDRCHNAKVIFVVASSISAVIGTDIKGVCSYMQDQVKTKLICFDQGGLKGDFSIGILETYKLLAKELVEKTEEKLPKTYNIIGLSMGQYRAKSDLWEIEQLMQEAFGYCAHAVLCAETESGTIGKTSVERIQNMSGAELNIVLRDEALSAAKILEKKYKTPYVFACPYGYEGTLKFLQEVSKIIGVSINPAMEKRLKEKAMQVKQFARFMTMQNKEMPTTSIISDYERVVGIKAILQELNFQIDTLISIHSVKHIEGKDENVKYITVEKEKIDLLKNMNKQIIFADDISLTIPNDSNLKVCTSAPFVTGTQRAQHMPIVGEKGCDYLLEKVDAYIQTLK